MKKEAENLRARAVAGEDFANCRRMHIKLLESGVLPPNTTMEVGAHRCRRTMLLLWQPKPGQISRGPEIPNGYFIYRLKAREVLPPGQVREEIKATLRSQRMQTEMRAIQDSAVPALDESYFGR